MFWLDALVFLKANGLEHLAKTLASCYQEQLSRKRNLSFNVKIVAIIIYIMLLCMCECGFVYHLASIRTCACTGLMRKLSASWKFHDIIILCFWAHAYIHVHTYIHTYYIHIYQGHRQDFEGGAFTEQKGYNYGFAFWACVVMCTYFFHIVRLRK